MVGTGAPNWTMATKERLSDGLSRNSERPFRYFAAPLVYIGQRVLAGSAILLTLITGAPVAWAQVFTIEIITEIREVSRFTFQVGEKSRQRIVVDFSNSSITSVFDTGKTTIMGFDFDSIRNDFRIFDQKFNADKAVVTAKGQTASRAAILPDIDYQFTIVIDKAASKASISGCHNEYPSYTIFVNGKKQYDRVQTGTAFVGLIGKCDVLISKQGLQI